MIDFQLDQIKYLERRKTDLENCFIAISCRQFEEIESIGHKMKGNGTTFGFPELSELGSEMEAAAKAKNQEVVLQLTKKFKQWFDSQTHS
ncbi:MAG: Hpt domain-containing protein [Pseudobdellovibrionaceae bacterium]